MLGWRRVSEAVLQKTPVSLTSKQFKATSNARNEAMFREATEFAMSITTLEKDMKALLKKMDVHFKNLRGILVSPLPRIYDEGPNGVQPLDGESRLLGANMDFELIPKAAEEAQKRIQEEVINPMHEWMLIYNQIMERMKVLEALRLELDSRRRTVANLQGKLTRLHANTHSGHDKQREIEDTTRLMMHKQEKMENTGHQYMEMERKIYHSLYTLVRDTAVLRDYTHCCLNIMKEAFGSASKAYDTVPQTQQSSTNAQPYSQPESKYESQMPNAERATPKGIAGLFDRLRGRTFKAPPSPSMRDAQDPDQGRRYGSGYNPYVVGERYPSGFGTHPSSMRPTHESDIPPTGAAHYIQQGAPMAGGYPAANNNYLPQPLKVPVYQPQTTGGNSSNGNYHPGAPSNFNPLPTTKYPMTGGYSQQPTSNGVAYQPSGELQTTGSVRDVVQEMPNAPTHQVMPAQRYQPQPQAMNGGAQGWAQVAM